LRIATLPVLITNYDIAAFEFFPGSQYINDLLSLVVENGLFRNEQHGRFRPDAQAQVRLHSQLQIAGGITHFEHGSCSTALFIDNRTNAYEAALEFLIWIGCSCEYGSDVFLQPTQVFLKDRRLNPDSVECDDLQDCFSSADFLSRRFF